MGILFVLMFYFVASSVLAVVSSGIFRFLASRYLGRRAIEHKRAVRIAAIFPFACVLFAGMWFVAYATINSLVFHRDPMLGDGWSTDIPNGYAIEMIDVTDQGYLHPIGTDINSSSTFQGVRRLQIAGKQIYGTRDTKSFDHLGTDSKAEDVFFAIDTASHSTRDFPSQALLQDYAVGQGAHLDMFPVEKIYERYRFGWFDWMSGSVLVVMPAAGFILLVRWFATLGRTGSKAPVSVGTT